MHLKLGCVIGNIENISEDVSGDGETTELKNNENFLKKKMTILVYWINYSLCSRK